MTKILLVEDNELNQDMLTRRLLRRGYEIVLANDGAEGLSLALSEQPDLILMDMNLPIMDGWEATRRLKADPRTLSIPIVALTAHAMVGDLEKAKEAGCDDYHSKPVELPKLLATIEALLAKPKSVELAQTKHQVLSIQENQQTTPNETSSPKNSDSVTILIVDDNEMNRDMLSRRLERVGYKILVAESGEEGLNLIQHEAIDLVLLDIMMPGISGLETLKLIREIHSKVQLPVLMATAKDQSDDIVLAFQLGANDYITKPIDFPVALARIQSQIHTIEVTHQESVTKSATKVSIQPTQPLQPVQPFQSKSAQPGEVAPQLQPITPKPLRHFAIVNLLFEDNFSDIYLARDTQQHINSTFVLEKLKISIDNQDIWESAKYFLRMEADRWKRLGKNDCISSVVKSFNQDRKIHFVKDSSVGTLLSKEIIPRNLQRTKYVVNLVVDGLKILELLHQVQLAHQNLKPSSFIRRQEDGRLVLFNSGIAARLTQTLQQKHNLPVLTDPSSEMYAPPEKGIDYLIHSNDIYSMGAIGLYAFTGMPPNKEVTNPKIRKLLWEYVAQKDEGFAQVLQKMLHEDPNKRYQSINHALDDIHTCCGFLLK